MEMLELAVELKWCREHIAALEAERDRLASSLTAIEDEKNSYIDYVGDALGQDADGESLWDAAQRVLSERDRLRAELAACRAALELIAAPQRSDGSWNRDREACRQVAQAALAAKEE